MEELRKVADCRRMQSEKNCSLTISGKESEVIPLAQYHAIHDHGHKDTPELSEEIRRSLVNEGVDSAVKSSERYEAKN